jgi:DNA-binding NtrC family response regulator
VQASRLRSQEAAALQGVVACESNDKLEFFGRTLKIMKQRLQVLVIDDEEYVRTLVAEILCDEGWEVCSAESAEQAFEMLGDQAWAVVFCDVRLGGADGYAVLRRFKEELPGVKVILMTGYGSASGALDAMSCGAYDYLLKPFGVDELRLIARSLREELAKQAARGPVSRDYRVSSQSDADFVGHSARFIEVLKQVGRVAPTNLPVFLTGESGTGKEVVASALHRRSARAD